MDEGGEKQKKVDSTILHTLHQQLDSILKLYVVWLYVETVILC